MSYIKADQVLPKELIEAIQQYIDGKSIYIPSKQKQAFQRILRERNRQGHI